MKKLLVVLALTLSAVSLQAGAATFFLTNVSNGDSSFGTNGIAGVHEVSLGAFTHTWNFKSDTAGTATFRLEGNEPSFSLNVVNGLQVLNFVESLADKVFSLTFLANQNVTFSVAGHSLFPDTISFRAIGVNPVPVPAAVWLFGSALMGLTGMRRKKA